MTLPYRGCALFVLPISIYRAVCYGKPTEVKQGSPSILLTRSGREGTGGGRLKIGLHSWRNGKVTKDFRSAPPPVGFFASLYYKVVVFVPLSKGMCYTVRDAVDWFMLPTA